MPFPVLSKFEVLPCWYSYPLSGIPKNLTLQAPSIVLSYTKAAPPNYPEIIQWFCYLDDYNNQNKDNITFSLYGTVLQSIGFIHISQLPDFIALKDLKEWLGIEVGMAILIMQYVRDDIEVLKDGMWVFPKESMCRFFSVLYSFTFWTWIYSI